jgi:hypothetical protein
MKLIKQVNMPTLNCLCCNKQATGVWQHDNGCVRIIMPLCDKCLAAGVYPQFINKKGEQNGNV